ncbi:MAG: starch-binding protein [Ruminococcus sp.]|nr:starch-binding protein [Ruminococcus sp.]
MKLKITGILLSLCMIVSCFAVTGFQATAADTSAKTTSADVSLSGAGDNQYGLANNIHDGTILHCFDWKYNDIKSELKSIAEAGFTTIQTSPAQASDSSGEWYWLYQPRGFYVGSNDLGSKSDLQNLCTEAHKYGIKVIVDVVANHLSGNHSIIQDDLKDGRYWHTYGGVSSWSDRYQVINGEIGMPDLKTEDSYVQSVVKKYLLELKGIGVDGYRFDAAKHIGLPSEGDQFFSMVKSVGLYAYGEILVGPDDRDASANKGLMQEYTNYISVTDSVYGKDLRDSFNSGNAPSTTGKWANNGCSPYNLVYWGESHDTWSNNHDWGYSNEMSQNTIDRAYAVAASRAQSTALYFSRPYSKVKQDIRAGQKGSTAFKNKEIGAVNRFHNAMTGQKEYYLADNNCAVTCREKGAVIVAGQGGNFDVTVQNGGQTCQPGTYKDQVSGSTWTVTSSSISGHIGDCGIAVIYNAAPAAPSVSISYNGNNSGGNFFGTAKVTLSCANTSSATYKLGSAAAKSYTSGTTITIGSDMSEGQSVNLVLNGTGTNGSTVSATYTFTKKARPSISGNTVIFYDNSQTNWSGVRAYVYRDGGTTKNGEWPGVSMTDLGDGLWGYVVDDNTFPDGYVIFADSTGEAQHNAPDEPGLVIRKGEWKIYSGGSWIDYDNPQQPTQSTQATQATQATQSTQASNTYYFGDINCDRLVNINDVTYIQCMLVKIQGYTPSSRGMVLGDVNSDGKVKIGDANYIQQRISGISAANNRTYAAYVEQTATTSPTQSTQATQATTPTQSTTQITVRFDKGNTNGTPVARCFNDDYEKHTDYTMQHESGNIYKISIPDSFRRIEFWFDNFNQKTQYYDIQNGKTYSR